MNTQTRIPTLLSEAPDLTQTESADATSSLPGPPANPSTKPKGKIASLPKDQRALINKMLDNGVTYAAVAAEMAKHGVSLNGENISNWYQSGFQDYLRRQDWLTQVIHLQENAADLPDPANLALHQAVLHVGVLKIFQSLKTGLTTGDPVNDIRLLNALARLSRLSAQVKKQADADLAKSNHSTATEALPRTTASPLQQ